ncbi:MAG: hypothetical protein ABI039_07405 [Vicinamibacterales bacterium]
MVPSEKFTHSMKDLCAELDKRIAKLEYFRDRLQGKISGHANGSKNSEALARVSNSLTHAKEARRSMESSCCDYSCSFELHDQ